MSPRYAVLAARIRQGIQDVSQTVERALRHAEAVERNPEEDAFVDSVALNLHDFYSGLERIFQRIASDIDDSLPMGDAWHRDLLDQMATDVKQVRPAVLSPRDAAALDEYLRFRHVVRNVYAFELDPKRVTELAKRLPSAFESVQRHLLEFAGYLEKLSESQ